MPVDFDTVIPAGQMRGEDEADTKLLQDMLEGAEAYIRSFKWCPPIAARFFGCGVGGVVAVFLFRFAKQVDGTDDLLWVVDGDVPSGYLVTDEAPDPASALTIYCDLMEEWARAVLDGAPLDKVFPVPAPSTSDNAEMLLNRTRFIREQVIESCHRQRR